MCLLIHFLIIIILHFIFSLCLMFPLFSSVQGKPKKNESLWGIACGVFRMLRKNYGCVRVDFTQPFSLKVRGAHLISDWLNTERISPLMSGFFFSIALGVPGHTTQSPSPGLSHSGADPSPHHRRCTVRL